MSRVEPHPRMAKMRQVDGQKLGLQILDELPSPVFLANQARQIVFANRALCSMLEDEADRIIGMRAGEVLVCENALLADGGCGCAESCSTCGALKSIQYGLQGRAHSDECRITRKGEEGIEALDLRVSSHPFAGMGEPMVLVHVADISDEKRRSNLETIFFHDVLNVAGSIRGFADILLDYDLKNPREVLLQLQEAAQQMIDEVEAQRVLARAESGDLTPVREPLESGQVLERVAKMLRGHEVAQDRNLKIADDSCREIFLSDPTLLMRCLVNLGKNALEASEPGESVTLGSRRVEQNLCFEVTNRAVMPPQVQQQVFQRSFSTRGSGRGVGTYSVRLLVERYLAGQVAFASDNASGTCFTITLPA